MTNIEKHAEAVEQASMAAMKARGEHGFLNMRDDDERLVLKSSQELPSPKPTQRANVVKPKVKAPTKASEPSNTGDYTIAKGDTLSAIAKRNNISVAKLKDLNNIADVNDIKAGAKLKFRDDPKPTESPVANALKKSEPLRVSKMDLNKIEANKSDGYASMTSYNKKGEDPRVKANRAVNEGLAMGTLIGGSAMSTPVRGAATAVKEGVKIVKKVAKDKKNDIPHILKKESALDKSMAARAEANKRSPAPPPNDPNKAALTQAPGPLNRAMAAAKTKPDKSVLHKPSIRPEPPKRGYNLDSMNK
jgi:LysM repeat protein